MISTIKNKKASVTQYPAILLAVIILCLSAYMIYWGTQKEGYHIDEMYSMMDIRGGGQERPYNQYQFHNRWRPASELESTIGVTSEYAFTAINNSRNFYWSLLHIAYSFQPDVFTIWPSMVLNILIFICSLIVIYLLSLLFISNRYLALLPGLVWGLSSAAVNLVVYIRFYMLLTLFCLMLTYAVLYAVKNGFDKWRHPFFIAIILYFGLSLHQYMYVYAFYLTAFTCIALLIKRDFILLLRVAGVIIVAVVAHEITMDSQIIDTFSASGSRSAQAISAVENLLQANGDTQNGNESAGNVVQYFNILRETVFANISLFIISAVIVALVILFITINIQRKSNITSLLKNQKVTFWLILTGVCLMYILTIAIIAPYRTYRYISCISPIAILLFISFLINTINTINNKKAATTLILSSVLVYSILLTVNMTDVHLYRSEKEYKEALEPYYNLPVICVSARERSWYVTDFYTQLFDFEDMVLFTTINRIERDISGFIDVINEQTFDDGLVLIIDNQRGNYGVGFIMDVTGLESSEEITDVSTRHKALYLK